MLCLARAFYMLVRGGTGCFHCCPPPSRFPVEGTLGSAQGMWLCVVGSGAPVLGLAGTLPGLLKDPQTLPHLGCDSVPVLSA